MSVVICCYTDRRWDGQITNLAGMRERGARLHVLASQAARSLNWTARTPLPGGLRHTYLATEAPPPQRCSAMTATGYTGGG